MFRDKTFCSFYTECKDGKTCHRALTDKVIASAHDWWNKGKSTYFYTAPPITMFSEKPDCFIKL